MWFSYPLRLPAGLLLGPLRHSVQVGLLQAPPCKQVLFGHAAIFLELHNAC